mgnify:FL=1
MYISENTVTWHEVFACYEGLCPLPVHLHASDSAHHSGRVHVFVAFGSRLF